MALGWLLLAWAALRKGPSSATTRSATTRSASSSSGVPVALLPAPGRWVWPLPRLGGRAPVISSGWGTPRDGHAHAGADVMYARRGPRMTWPKKGPLPDHGSPAFELPRGTPVLAAADGTIWSTGETERGHSVVISHTGTGLATFYQHLETLAVPPHKRGKQAGGAPPMRVKAGQPIGTAGWSRLDSRQIRHLHFELRRGVTPFDPAASMRGWEIV